MSGLPSRLAAVALLLAVLALAFFGAVRPILGWQAALEGKAVALEQGIARFAARLGTGPARVEVAEPALIEAGDAMLAAARLQQTLNQAVAGAGGTVRSVSVERPVPEGVTALRVRLSADLVIDIAGLRALLHTLETHRPYLVVERLALRRLRPGEPDIALALRLAGFVRRPDAPGSGASRS